MAADSAATRIYDLSHDMARDCSNPYLLGTQASLIIAAAERIQRQMTHVREVIRGARLHRANEIIERARSDAHDIAQVAAVVKKGRGTNAYLVQEQAAEIGALAERIRRLMADATVGME